MLHSHHRVCNIVDADKAYLILSNLILFTCSFNSATLSLGLEGEPFGARKMVTELGSVGQLSRLNILNKFR